MSEKYSFIDAEKAHYPIVKMCAWLQVSDAPLTSTAVPLARPLLVAEQPPIAWLLWVAF